MQFFYGLTTGKPTPLEWNLVIFHIFRLFTFPSIVFYRLELNWSEIESNKQQRNDDEFDSYEWN